MLKPNNLHQVIEYYDRPILYTCFDGDHTWYLAILYEETEYKEVFLYVELSLKRIDQLYANEVDLYTTFKEAERGVLIQNTRYFGSHLETFKEVSLNQVDDNRLPCKGEYLTRSK